MRAEMIILTVLFTFAGCENHAANGETMPEFDLMMPDSTVFNTANIPEGQPIVMIYYDGECGECHEEIRDIINRMDDLTEVRFYLITIEPLTGIQRFKDHLRLDLHPNIVVAKDTAMFFPRYVKARTTPYIVLFDRKKNMKAIMGNRPPIDTLIKYINQL